VKIADFGISQMLSETHEKLEDAAGTPAFMAPELCENKSFSGQMADIWAIGATVYMLKFGHPPFIAKNIVNLYYKICNDPLSFPVQIDPGLRNLLEGMLEKNPDKRMNLAQISAHPWFRFPPPPTPKLIPPPRMITSSSGAGTTTSTTSTPHGSNNATPYNNNSNQKNNESSSSSSRPSSSQTTANQNKLAETEFLNFQPPSTYDAEHEAAMKNPIIELVTPTDVYMSIGGIRRMSDSNIENAIMEIDDDYEEEEEDDDDDDNDAEKTKKTNALKKPKFGRPLANADEEKTPEMNQNHHINNSNNTTKGEGKTASSAEESLSDNLLQTNWGNDVFEIVDDVNDDDDDDDVDEVDDDDDDSDEDEKKDKVSLSRSSKNRKGKNKKNQSQFGSSFMMNTNGSTVHTEMSAEEEMRRSKQFLKKNVKKSSNEMKSSTSNTPDPKNSSKGSNISQISSPTARARNSYYNSDSTSYGPESPSQVAKRFFPKDARDSSNKQFSMTKNADNHSRISLMSQNDLDEEAPEQLSNEEFAKLMDTLSQQPSKAVNNPKSYEEDDYDEEDDDEVDNNEGNEKERRKNAKKTLFEDNDMDGSFDFLIAPLQNLKNEVGCAFHSEQGTRPSQEDRCLAVINFLQYFQQQNILSSSSSSSNSITNNSSSTTTAASSPLSQIYNQVNNIRDSLNQISLFAVFDGHSGSKTSHFLYQNFVKRFIENEKFLESKNVENCLLEAFFLLDYDVSCHFYFLCVLLFFLILHF
jgi:serine/threonine protein kinase